MAARSDLISSEASLRAGKRSASGRDIFTTNLLWVCAGVVKRRSPHATLRSEIFEHSSHLPHVEETDCYLEVVARFLDACDKTR